MPLNLVVIPGILLASLIMLFAYGIARTFVFVWIPSVLLFFLAPEIRVPGLPDLTPMSAVGYAVLAMAIYRWDEIRRVKWNALDVMIVLMMIPPCVSALLNNTLWEAISKWGDLFFVWIIPYFMARIAMTDAPARKLLFRVICISAIVLGAMALFEARMKPYFVSRTYEMFNLNRAKNANQQVFYRFGLMRAQGPLGHSIDLGICGTLLGGLVIGLAPVAGRRWREPLPLAAIGGAGVMVVCAVSFTGLSAMAVAFVLLAAFSRPWLGRYLPLATVVGVILLICFLMTEMISRDIPTERPNDPLLESAWIRARIVQEGWSKAQETGLFGGGRYIDTTGIGVGSVDNAYMLFILSEGWLYLFSWIALALVVGYMGMKTLAAARTSSERLPVAAVLASLVATFLAMYTVFYGFVYALLLLAVLGIFSTMSQLLRQREQAAPAYVAPPAMPRGFPVRAG